MLVIGVDPGLTGAIALLRVGHGLIECADIPVCPNSHDSGSMRNWVDEPALRELLAQWSRTHGFATEFVHAVIERPIAMPRLPSQTIAAQFDTFGVLRAVLARYAELHFVEPRTWKKFFGLKTDKTASRECCLRLYPDAPVKRVKDHNRSEAILIGHFCMRNIA